MIQSAKLLVEEVEIEREINEVVVPVSTLSATTTAVGAAVGAAVGTAAGVGISLLSKKRQIWKRLISQEREISKRLNGNPKNDTLRRNLKKTVIAKHNAKAQYVAARKATISKTAKVGAVVGYLGGTVAKLAR